jgi:hypothetical protein
MRRKFDIFFVFISFCFTFCFTSEAFAQPTHLVFITPEQTIPNGEVSNIITVQIQDAAGDPISTMTEVTISLSTTSATGEFSVAPAPWTPITGVNIPVGANSVSFYYKDTIPGTPTIHAVDDPVDIDDMDGDGDPATGVDDLVDASQTVTITGPTEIIINDDAATIGVLPVGVVSGEIKISLDEVAAMDILINLTTTSPTGEFSETAEPWTPITQVTIEAGSSYTQVYYKDTTPGEYTLTASDAEGVLEDDMISVGIVGPTTIFIEGPEHVPVGVVSREIVIVLDTFVAEDLLINLTTTSPTGEFSETAEPWTSITQVTILAGKREAQVYYRDITPGEYVIIASDELGVLVDGEHFIIVTGPTNLIFITELQSIHVNQASGDITIEAYRDGEPHPVGEDTVILLTTTSQTGEFSQRIDFLETITEVIIEAGKSSVSFYYRDSTPGIHTLTAAETPPLGWEDATHIIEILPPENNPPNPPQLISPENGLTNVRVTPILMWRCTDPDGDPLTFDVYLEAENPEPGVRISSKQSATKYTLKTSLQYDTTYYWKVVACDPMGATSTSEVWHFTTSIFVTEIPHFINYQGKLTSPETGRPIADGTYAITFRIYNAEIDGTLLWEETQSVEVKGGLFHVLLGNVNSIQPELFNTPQLWLALKVEDDEEMVPRLKFVSAPYAFKAAIADTVDGFHADELLAPPFSLSALDGDPEEAVYVDADGNVVITGDIKLQKNGEMLYRIFELEDALYLENLKTGKLYKFILEEVK